MPKTFDPETMAPAKGRPPTLQFCALVQLEVDHTYQRSVECTESQILIRKIAARWNWDLCQPLVVSRREDRLYVIDGQHRLEAAKLRGDIAHLPCVVGTYNSVQEEAGTFTELNDRRRPISALDKFRAALASEQPEALAIHAAMQRAGLALAPHENARFWKPGEISNIGGVRKLWASHGPRVTELALSVLSVAFPGKVLIYAGTLLPGIATCCAAGGGNVIGDDELKRLMQVLARFDQAVWRSRALKRMAEDPGMGRQSAMADVLRRAMEQGEGVGASPSPTATVRIPPLPPVRPVPSMPSTGKSTKLALDNFDARQKKLSDWCTQCDQLVSMEKAARCKSQWCKLRDVAA